MKTYGAAPPAPPQRHRWWSRVAAVVATTLAIGMLVAVNPTPAEAATVDTNAWYVLVNRNSGKALDVHAASTADGARVSQWTRNDGANQQWQFVDSGGGFYRLKARHSGKVLDVARTSTADGAPIQQWADHNGTNQSRTVPRRCGRRAGGGRSRRWWLARAGARSRRTGQPAGRSPGP